MHAWSKHVFSFAVLAGCTGSSEDARLRLGVTNDALACVTKVAVRSRYAGVRELRRAFLARDVDLVVATTVDLAILAERSTVQPLALFEVADRTRPKTLFVLSRKLSHARELAGARVGVPPASWQLVELARALSAYGLTLDDIETVADDENGLVDALLGGEVDAIAVSGVAGEAVAEQLDVAPLHVETSAVRDVIIGSKDVWADAGRLASLVDACGEALGIPDWGVASSIAEARSALFGTLSDDDLVYRNPGT